jgi:hypothetical protein
VKVANAQSVPARSASILVAWAVPTLPKVPRHPRGDVNSPWVLICAGGLFPGVSAVVAVVVMVSHEWSDRTVVLKDWRLV